MADSEVRQKFEAWWESERDANILGNLHTKLVGERAYSAGMRAGEISMREKAANLASDLWEADENPCASPMCSEIPAAIRALPAAPEEKR